jgi:hypothetical protein
LKVQDSQVFIHSLVQPALLLIVLSGEEVFLNLGICLLRSTG